MIVKFDELGKKLEEKIVRDKKSSILKASEDLEIPNSSLDDILKNRASPKTTNYFIKLIDYLNIPFITIIFDEDAFNNLNQNSKQSNSTCYCREDFLPIYQKQFDKLVVENEAAKHRLGKQ